EDGVITNGSVGSAAGASAGQMVGVLDFLDSSVALEVFADEAGPYTLGVRFSNGSERGGYTLASTSTVTVNGADAGVITFPHTTWGNWQSVTHQVSLVRATVFQTEVPPTDPQVTVTAQPR